MVVDAGDDLAFASVVIAGRCEETLLYFRAVRRAADPLLAKEVAARTCSCTGQEQCRLLRE
jgi:hypothetical protein